MATPPTLFSLPPEIKIIIAKMVALQDEVFNINDNWEGLGELERKQRGRAATTLSGQSASALSKTCKAWHAILVPFLFEASQTLSSSKVHHFDRLFLAELLPKYLSHFKTFALDSPTTEPRFLIALSYVLLLPNLVCLRLDRQHLVSLHLFARTSAFRAIAPRITGLEITSYDNYSELLNGFVNLTSLELSNSLDSNVELQVSRDQLAQAPKLTHLVLNTNRRIEYLSGSSAPLPLLRSLVLEGTILPATWELVRSVHSTLEQLRISTSLERTGLSFDEVFGTAAQLPRLTFLSLAMYPQQLFPLLHLLAGSPVQQLECDLLEDCGDEDPPDLIKLFPSLRLLSIKDWNVTIPDSALLHTTEQTREQGVTVRTSLADPWYSFDDYSKAEERLALKFRYDTIKRLTGFVESEAGRQMLQNDVVGSNQLVDALEGVIGYRYLYED